MTKQEPSPSKLSRPGDAELDINSITGLPQAEHDRRVEDLTNLWVYGGLGKPKDMELSIEFILLRVRAGKLLTPAQHDHAMDHIVSHYQYFPNPAQYHAAGLGVSVASLTKGADEADAEEAQLWDWFRANAERLSEGYRATLTLESGTVHEGATRCVKEWLEDLELRYSRDKDILKFCHVRVEMPSPIPLLMETIFDQIAPTVGKALQQMVDYTTIGNDFFRHDFRKAALLVIASRTRRANRQLTAPQAAFLLTYPSPIPDHNALASSFLEAPNGLRVFEGILSLEKNIVSYHSVETLQGALDEAGNPLFTDRDIANQLLLIENRAEILGYVPYLRSEKIRLEGAQRKAEERAADLARAESLQRRKETEGERVYNRELHIRDLQNERDRELRQLRDDAYGPDRQESDEEYEKYYRERREGPARD